MRMLETLMGALLLASRRGHGADRRPTPRP